MWVQFASVEVIVTMIQDHFGDAVKKYLRRKEVLVLVVCIVSFLCGLPNITQVGIFSLTEFVLSPYGVWVWCDV